jgi:hypothetical protein
MKALIIQNSYVSSFPHNRFKSDLVKYTLENEADMLLKRINLESHKDWTVRFEVVYGDKPEIWIYTSMPSYKKEKQKSITIHVPIPTKDIVEWGVNPSQIIKVGMPNENGFTKLKVEFKQFINIEDYIMDCLRRAILTCFTSGFTIDGRKVKLNSGV